MKYALAKFRVYLLGDRPFIVYTDHASSRTDVNSPHLLQRMERWMSFFAEYNFYVKYKPGRLNVVADALSRRPDLEPTAPLDTGPTTVAVLTSSVPSSTLLEDIRKAYDPGMMILVHHLSHPSGKSLDQFPSLSRSFMHRYTVRNGLLQKFSCCRRHASCVLPDHSGLRLHIMYDYHGTPVGGHRGREKTYLTVSRDFYWPCQYQFVCKKIRACEAFQQVKSIPSLCAPFQSLPVPT